jgi:hyperosmotically inducible periplasmic protein
MKTLRILSSLALIAFASACGNTADGVKQDADKAAEKTAEVASDASSAMGGAAKTTEVKAAIMADSRVDAGDINVDTDDTAKTVTLNGTVKTEAAKTIAGEIATAKATGFTVVNNLTIKP